MIETATGPTPLMPRAHANKRQQEQTRDNKKLSDAKRRTRPNFRLIGNLRLSYTRLTYLTICPCPIVVIIRLMVDLEFHCSCTIVPMIVDLLPNLCNFLFIYLGVYTFVPTGSRAGLACQQSKSEPSPSSSMSVLPSSAGGCHARQARIASGSGRARISTSATTVIASSADTLNGSQGA